MEPSDEAVVEQCLRGDTEAYAVLVRRYRDRIYSHAFYLTGDPEAAADLTQEALIRAYQALPRFRPEAQFAPWLHRIAVNLCVSWQRRQKYRLLSTEDLDEGTPVADPFNPTPPATPEEVYEAVELQTVVRRVLRGLPISYRQVLVLRYLEDRSYREIAATLGLPVTTVENRLRTGRRLLRERLAEVIAVEPDTCRPEREERSEGQLDEASGST